MCPNPKGYHYMFLAGCLIGLLAGYLAGFHDGFIHVGPIA